jgi:hypothetical protein
VRRILIEIRRGPEHAERQGRPVRLVSHDRPRGCSASIRGLMGEFISNARAIVIEAWRLVDPPSPSLERCCLDKTANALVLLLHSNAGNA